MLRDDDFEFNPNMFNDIYGNNAHHVKGEIYYANPLINVEADYGLARAHEIMTTTEGFINAGDVAGYAAFYKSISTDDFVFQEEFYGVDSSHNTGDCSVIEYTGTEKLAEVITNWMDAMPDLIISHSNIQVFDNGKLVTANWICNGTKVADVVKYPTPIIHTIGYNNSVNSKNATPDVYILGTMQYHFLENGKLFKFRICAHVANS